MKIVKKGKVKEKEPQWWIGLVITCETCGSQIKLEELDDFGLLPLTQGKRSDDKATIQFICPLEGCRAKVHYEHQFPKLQK